MKPIKQLITTFYKLCRAYTHQMVLNIKLWWAKSQQTGIKFLIKHLKSNKSATPNQPFLLQSGSISQDEREDYTEIYDYWVD